MTTAQARWLMVGAALLFSTGGAAIKFSSLSGATLGGLRSVVAALALFVLVPACRRGLSWRVLPVSVVHAMTLLLFVAANTYTTAANAIFLQSTAPLWIVLLGPYLVGERIKREDLPVMGLVGAGLLCFVMAGDPATPIATSPELGNALAIGSGLTWGLTLLGLRRLARDTPDGAAASAALGNVIAAVATIPAWSSAFPLGLGNVGVVLFLGIFQVALAYVWMTAAFPHVPALTASLLLLMEPVLSTGWAWLLHGEQPAPLALTGAAVLMSGLVVQAWWANRSSMEEAA